MSARTIELNKSTTITPAAGGRFIVRSNQGVEVVKAPAGAIRLSNGSRPMLAMGSLARTTVIVTGSTDDSYEQLRQVFTSVTGVEP